MSGAAAWVALTSTAPATLGVHPLPTSSVVLGALVTAGAALLPDVDHHGSTIARSGGLASRAVAGVAGAAAGGHRAGLHSLVAVAAFTAGTVAASRWEHTLPVVGTVPAGSALMLLALVAFATKALGWSRGGIARLWAGAAAIVAAILAFAPEQLEWLPLSVMVGVIVHLIGDLITVGGVPLLWPLRPAPPKGLRDVPVLTSMWKKNGHFAVPILGRTGSAVEWVLFVVLSAYTAYGLAGTTGLLTVTA